jgi:hypothetical protein
MRRALLAAAVMLVATAAPAGSATTAPERLLVTSDEWNLVLSKTKLEPGPAIVELYNRGEDAHDVRIKRGGAGSYVPIPETGSEQSNRIQTRFKAGRRYVLWCSLEGHRELGMEAELRAAKR